MAGRNGRCWCRLIKLLWRCRESREFYVIFGTVFSEMADLGTRRHEDPAPSDPVIEMSEQDFESVSRRNVERWVSAHIIPVRHSHPAPTFSIYIF